MKEFSIQEQIYICKNSNSKTLEELAVATLSTKADVKNEFNNMKNDGRYEKYRKMSDKEIQEFIYNTENIKKDDSENNTLLELNNILFEQLRSLTDDSLNEVELNRELKTSKQVVSVSQTIINNASLLLQAKKHIDSTKEKNNSIAPLLSLGEKDE